MPINAIDLCSEASSVASLIGMVVLTTNPEVGIPMMLGGQILSWVFSYFHQDQENPPTLPSLEDIRAAMSKLLVHEHAKDLAEEANSAWSDIQPILARGWVDGIAPTDADLKVFMDIVKRVVDMSQVGTVHDNTNKLLYLCNTTDQDKATGLLFIPLFTWSATVELNCWQYYTLALMAETGAGRGNDADKNIEYKAALINQKQRFDTLVSALDELFKKSETAQDERIKQVTDLIETTSPTPRETFLSTGFIKTYTKTLIANDNGTNPPPMKANPVVSVEEEGYVEKNIAVPWSSVENHIVEGARKPAELALDAYKTSLSSAAAAYFGIVDADKQKETLDNWKKGQTEASRLVEQGNHDPK